MVLEGLVDWYCKPVENGKWVTLIPNALGAYTPCATETLVVALSHLVLLCLICFRIWLIRKDFSVKRFCLQSRLFNYGLGALVAYNTAEPLYRVVMGISVVNLDGQGSLAPFEVVTLLVESVTWCTMLALLCIETKVYIREFRWYIRFGVIYVLVGEATLFKFILTLNSYYDRSVLYLYISEIICQEYFGCGPRTVATSSSQQKYQDSLGCGTKDAALLDPPRKYQTMGGLILSSLS